MCIWRAFSTYLKKAVGQWSFFGTIVFLCLLCFTSSSVMENSVSYTVLESWLRFTRSQQEASVQFSALNQFLCGMGTYSLMFAPMLAALPTAPLLCRERSNGALRFILPRSGLNGYALGFQLACILCGGLVILGGYGLFGLCCLALFPTGATYGMTAMESVCQVLPQLAGAFFLGASSVSIAVLLCSFSRNPYNVLCGSFTLQYALSTICVRINLASSYDDSVLPLVTQTVNPNTPFIALFMSQPVKTLVLVYHLLVACIAFAVFRFCLGRRLDRGQ